MIFIIRDDFTVLNNISPSIIRFNFESFKTTKSNVLFRKMHAFETRLGHISIKKETVMWS